MDNKGFRFLEQLVSSFDESKRPQAIALIFGCMVLAIATTLDLAMGIHDPWQRVWLTGLAAVGAWTGLAVLLTLRSVFLASALICSSVALEISIQYVLTRDIYLFCFMAAVPIGMTLLVGRRTGISWAVIYSLVIVGLALCEYFEWMPIRKMDFRRIDILDAIPVISLMFALVCIGIFSEALRMRAERRRESNRRLLEAERRRFETVTQSAFHGIFEFSNSGRIEFASDGVKKVFGYEPDSLLDKTIFNLIHAEDYPLVRSQMQNPSRDDVQCDVRFLHADGSTVRAEVACDQIETPGSPSEPAESSLFVLAFKNVEHRRQVQEKLLEAQKLGGLAEFAGGMAHDFNNLLTAITGYAEMVPEEKVKTGILQATEQAASLTRQIMTFGRKQEIHQKLVNVNEVILSCQPTIRSIVREEIDIEFDLDEEVTSVYADPTHLQQVILNLVTNARDAMPFGGVLQIQTIYHRTGEPSSMLDRGTPQISLLVQDNGFGMTDEIQQKAFDPFFSTKDKSVGSGLGLSSVYGVVQQCNGVIDLQSATGEGTRVHITLPAFDSVESESTSDHGQLDDQTPTDIQSTIILVEDEELVLGVLGNALRNAGYTVFSFNAAPEAYDFLQSGEVQVDLLISDIVMPGMRGTELAQKMRMEQPDLPVLLMSGYHDVALEGYGKFIDEMQFLPKPFLIPDLLQAVEELTANLPTCAAAG